MKKICVFRKDFYMQFVFSFEIGSFNIMNVGAKERNKK